MIVQTLAILTSGIVAFIVAYNLVSRHNPAWLCYLCGIGCGVGAGLMVLLAGSL